MLSQQQQQESSVSYHMLMAEYTALREEIMKLTDVQFQLVAIAIISFGTLLGAGIASKTSSIILVYPILAVFLSASWFNQEYGIDIIEYYIQNHIEVIMGDKSIRSAKRSKKSVVSIPRQILNFLGARGIFPATQIIALIAGTLEANFSVFSAWLFIIASLSTIASMVFMVVIAGAQSKGRRLIRLRESLGNEQNPQDVWRELGLSGTLVQRIEVNALHRLDPLRKGALRKWMLSGDSKTQHPNAFVESAAQMLLERKKSIETLEAENRELRGQIAKQNSVDEKGSDVAPLHSPGINPPLTLSYDKDASSYLGQQTTFIQTILHDLIRSSQDINTIVTALDVSLQDLQFWMIGTALPTEQMQSRLWELYLARVCNDQKQLVEPSLHMRILEEPLTLSTLNMAFTALTELSTKCWLVAQNRFADLQQYAQTHDKRFVRETGVIIGNVSHNSPFNIDINLSASNVAEAVITTVDGIVQSRSRLAQKELEILTQAQAFEQATQRAEHEQQMATLEREKQKLSLEEQRLVVLEKRLDLQKKAVEYSLELAGAVVDRLQPGLDPAARSMAMQAILPNILQLQDVTGLAIVLPPALKNEDINQVLE